MNKKILALSLILILTSVYITSVSVSAVKAQTSTPLPTGGWITQYNVQDASTGETILNTNVQTGQSTGNGEILSGDELEVTVTISISQTSPSTDLSLTTDMQHSQLQSNMYWQQPNSNYNLGNFNPNSKTIVFPETAGTLVISCYGLVSANVQQSGPNGITLDIPTPLQLVILEDPTGNILDQVKLNVTDGNIDNYLTALAQKESTVKSLKSSGVDPGFIQIYQNVIAASQVMEGQGFATQATQMLNGLNVASPPSAGEADLLIPVAAIMAVIAVIFAFMFMRIRGKVSYMQLVVEDQIKDLEGLTMRISRIDRMASSNLESVKDRLKRLVGM